MSLRIRFRFDGKCSLHSRYNPETDGRPQHKNCPGCESLDVISMYTRIARKEVQREFSQGDRVQFTAASRELQIVNRELGTIERVSHSGNLEIRMDCGREVRFHNREHPHLDHGYAVTSHSSQGQTADRVLIHVDTGKSELLVNSRLHMCRSRAVNRMLGSIRMTEANSGATSVVIILNAQRPK